MSLGSFKLFNWDAWLAVVDEETLEGFVLTEERGWLPVSSADIEWDGRPIDEAFARAAFGVELEAFGSDPRAKR